MNNKVIAIENFEHICFKCLKEKEKLQKYSLHRSEYGSSFDNNYTYLQICEDCKPQGIDKWINEKPKMNDGYCATYEYEKNIIDFVNTFQIEGQELFWNRCSYGACADNMDSQDWIDEKLGVLSDEKYEEYGMYSPRQINAYKEKFPTCEHPVNVVYSDSSNGCWCPFGAYGEYNQKLSVNISDNCFKCKYYKKREAPIKEMDSNTYNKYELYIQGKVYKDLFE